ncbi:TonB-dependent receptor [Aurantiacibacter xanthus]|uniref:TonB-dependent receptor n=1 Tax=Aurantiacibacter xanthus TaxID=1784712 RepID=A0A3A1P0U7_9SPHN|nr:TonB-dependent receptor [Aurantiacibacter xanthus]RIV82425.1 TonB-dependent receptor [Aurantiacibacter xanthus]
MTSRHSKCVRAALGCTSAIYLFAGTQIVHAQQGPEAAQSQDESRIVVTGSRIQRRDFEASSPIVTAGEDLFENSSTAAIETSLNKLPAFTPVQTPSLGGDVQPTATSTPGAATVSLRGLGTNRNLVLVDGRRATPANALGVVDINTIPSAAIERVEIITGGASATYGADAIGGVVNFILKKDFQGLELDASAGISQEGDGFEYSLSGLMGTNFADGRGNVTIGFSTNTRESAYARDRDYQIDAWNDPRFVGTEFFPDFSGFQPLGGVNPSQAVYDGLFGAGNVSAGSRLYFNPDGTAFTGFFQSPPGGSSRFKGDLSDPKYKLLNDGSLGQNFQDALVVLPLTRYNIYARGNYEINDWIGAFAQMNFTTVRTDTIQQPSPSVNGWSALVPASNPVPDELRTILDSRTIPVGTSQAALEGLGCDPTATPGVPGSGASCNWQLTYYLDYANREASTDVQTYNVTGGFEGSVPGTDWTWEAFVQHGESQTSTVITGIASLSRLREVLTSPDWGRGFSAQGNAAFGGFGAASATCTSGLDPFDLDLQISEDCIKAISATLQSRSKMRQTVFEANVQGPLFELPAGEVRAAFGTSYRENKYEFINDSLTSQGISFQDQAVGIYPSGSSEGFIKVHDIYGEVLIPLLSDLPAIESLELTLGARHSDYNTTGTATTWKIMADWEVTDFLRLRGGFNKAVRAPNVAELFLAPQQTFTAAGGGDVCRLNNTLSYSANPNTNSNAANVEAVCRILMDQSIAGTADTFYSNPQFYNALGPAFAFPTLVGNASVKPETAKTWTIGAVIDSPFHGSDLLNNLRLSVDYYNIAVDDAIGPQTLDSAQRSCFDPTFNPDIASNPAAAAANPFCQAIGRVAGDGALGNVQTTFLNNGRFRTEGVDVQLNWRAPVGPGDLSLTSVFNYLITMKSSPLPASAGPAGDLVEYAGTLGPAGSNGVAENGLNPGSFRWKMLNTIGYSVGPATVSLQWQHQPAAKSITYAFNKDTPFVGSPAYDLFNLSASLAATDNVTLRFGIDNLFNRKPPLVEYNAETTGLANAVGSNPINPYFFDLIGRRFYLGAKMTF